MNNDRKQKIIKTLLSLIISFLIIFIIAMFARAASNTILPSNSRISVFINDYLDMMTRMIDKAAVNLNIKRNTVSEYQINLISQSISDYVGYSMYQTADVVKNYNPNKNYSKSELEKYKNDYYKMTVENPYLRGMTVFGTDGKMRLNLYLSKNKSWPLELNDDLIKEIIKKGSLVLNATNENTFYIMEYIKNNFGEMIVATRNDYSYVSDIAMYYLVADKRLYVSDSRNLIYNVRESIGDDNTIEKVSSVINRFAYYKKQPSFIVNDSLSVSMIGKEYPNYFELIVLALTALLILFFQLILNGIINFFKYLMQIKSDRDYMNSLQIVKDDEEESGDIDENIINAELPKSNAIEDMPPIVEKVYYKIPEEYKEPNKEKFNIKKEISNLVSNIKNEINKKDFEVEEKTENENIENAKEENNIEALIQNEEIDDNFNNINPINNINIIQEDDLNEIIEDINDIKIENEEIDEETNNIEDIESIIEDSLTGEIINNILNNEEENSEELINEIDKQEENDINETDIKIDEEILENVNRDILDSYNNVLTNHAENKKEFDKEINSEEKLTKDLNKNNSEDVFAAFDKMLASIISKAEEDAKTIIKK
ncbi:hypothetical protein [Brachyspira sp.]|uniref:hypothetical protein n=1 Tax=Brachyspira sp. TaxID=1977261 RepID=UPI003D7C4059